MSETLNGIWVENVKVFGLKEWQKKPLPFPAASLEVAPNDVYAERLDGYMHGDHFSWKEAEEIEKVLKKWRGWRLPTEEDIERFIASYGSGDFKEIVYRKLRAAENGYIVSDGRKDDWAAEEEFYFWLDGGKICHFSQTKFPEIIDPKPNARYGIRMVRDTLNSY